MTDKLRKALPVLLAAAAAAAPACKRARSAVDSAPAAKPSVAVSLVAAPAASTAKPIDASDAMRGSQRPAPAPPAAPCLSGAGADPAVPDLLEQASRDFEKGRYEDALECAREAGRGNPQSVLTGSTNWAPTGLCTQANNTLIIDDANILFGFLYPTANQHPQIINARRNMDGMVPIQVPATGFCAGVFPAALD